MGPDPDLDPVLDPAFFILMWIQIPLLIKVMRICDQCYIPSGLHFDPLKLLNFDFTADPDLDFPSNADPDPQPWVKVSRTRRRCNFPKIPPSPPSTSLFACQKVTLRIRDLSTLGRELPDVLFEG